MAKDAGVYASGVLYSLPEAIEELRASGMTTVVAWALHVHENGDLIFNDPTIVSDGRYVGDPQWPARMASLKQAPTKVNRLLFSTGGWESQDFANIGKLIQEGGTGPAGILYRNFAALKKTIPGIDGIDFDQEQAYDEETTLRFATMLHELGYTVTFCPYEKKDFWVECLWKLNNVSPGLVSAFNLQCYAGGEGNEPQPWIEKVAEKMGPDFDSKTFIRPGLWCRHSEHDRSCSEGECPDAMRTKLAGWRSSGIDSAWVWMLDEIRQCKNSGTCTGPMGVATYAQAILAGLGDAPNLESPRGG